MNGYLLSVDVKYVYIVMKIHLTFLPSLPIHSPPFESPFYYRNKMFRRFVKKAPAVAAFISLGAASTYVATAPTMAHSGHTTHDLLHEINDRVKKIQKDLGVSSKKHKQREREREIILS